MADAPSVAGMTLRNQKCEDLGEVMHDDKTIEECFLYDEKEVFVQRVNVRMQPTLTIKNDENYLHLLIRVFNPATWELSPIEQFRISKTAYGSDLAKYICTVLFPGMQPETLFVSRYDYNQLYKRGDLALKTWKKLDLQKCSLA